MTQTTTRPIPATDEAACLKYRANIRGCDCADKMRRGGSYTVQGYGSVCKHQAYRIAERAEQMAANAAQADRAERAINRLYHPEPKRLSVEIDDGLAGFFGYRVSMPAPVAPAAQPLAGPCRVPADDFDCFELV